MAGTYLCPHYVMWAEISVYNNTVREVSHSTNTRTVEPQRCEPQSYELLSDPSTIYLQMFGIHHDTFYFS